MIKYYQVSSRFDYEVCYFGVCAAQIDVGAVISGCDAHDNYVALQIKSSIMQEASVTLEEEAECRHSKTVGRPRTVKYKHSNVMHVWLQNTLVHDGLHERQPYMFETVGRGREIGRASCRERV